MPALWLYHAHYCDDVASSEVPDEDKRRLVEDWLRGNPPVTHPGWDAYPTSRRIVNWLKFCVSGGQLAPDAIDSLATQADHLARDFEFHLLGNHLLANLKAMIFVGLILDTPSSSDWLQRAERLLEQELAEQILADGGHHELSPMYHAVVLEDLLDIVNIAAAARPHLAEKLVSVCRSMLDWLVVMTHPDGRISFFNDAALNGCASTDELLGYAARLGIQPSIDDAAGLVHLRQSGYVRMQNGSMMVIADIAAVGPAHLPGHAHADSLSFELSVLGRRVVVNSGTSTYADGPERHRQRGTAAHSTVVIDDENSSDVWSAFRVGRRASITERSVSESDETMHVSGSHDGYRHRAGILHSRSWELSSEQLTIRDTIAGHGEHVVEWNMHLHPEVVSEELAPGHIRLALPDTDFRLEVKFDRKLVARTKASSYHPAFGCEMPSSRIEASGSLRLPCETEVTVRLIR